MSKVDYDLSDAPYDTMGFDIRCPRCGYEFPFELTIDGSAWDVEGGADGDCTCDECGANFNCEFSFESSVTMLEQDDGPNEDDARERAIDARLEGE